MTSSPREPPRCWCPNDWQMVNDLNFCLSTPTTDYRTRKGAATEAIRLLARSGFGTLGLVRIKILVAVGNFASQRAAEKAGVRREGLLRNRVIHRGELRDAYMFSLIPSAA
jgi:RimJ/RimL family protein N-acetyltransferase